MLSPHLLKPALFNDNEFVSNHYFESPDLFYTFRCERYYLVITKGRYCYKVQVNYDYIILTDCDYSGISDDLFVIFETKDLSRAIDVFVTCTERILNTQRRKIPF